MLPSFANFHICSVFVFSPSFHSAFRFYCAVLFLFSFKIAFHKTFFLIIIYPLLKKTLPFLSVRFGWNSARLRLTQRYKKFMQAFHKACIYLCWVGFCVARPYHLPFLHAALLTIGSKRRIIAFHTHQTGPGVRSYAPVRDTFDSFIETTERHH